MKELLAKHSWVLVVVIIIALLVACQGGIVGNGKVETREKEIGNFNRLVIKGNFRVYLEQTGKPSLRMEMDENLLDVVRITEEGNTLRIETKINILQAREKNLYIGVKDLEKLELGGAVNFRSDSVMKFETLGILATGAVRLNFEIEADQLKLNLEGASESDISGKVDVLRMQLSGAGDFDAFDLIARDVEIDLSGAGGARLYATEKLDVTISGAGSVRYRGEPEVHKKISGLGSLKRDF
jgi:hypothetical protein